MNFRKSLETYFSHFEAIAKRFTMKIACCLNIKISFYHEEKAMVNIEQKKRHGNKGKPFFVENKNPTITSIINQRLKVIALASIKHFFSFWFEKVLVV
jgi:hypothetical protein